MRLGGEVQIGCAVIYPYHSHFRKVEETVVGKVGRALLDEGQVGQVDAQVWDARRVTSIQTIVLILDGNSEHVAHLYGGK